MRVCGATTDNTHDSEYETEDLEKPPTESHSASPDPSRKAGVCRQTCTTLTRLSRPLPRQRPNWFDPRGGAVTTLASGRAAGGVATDGASVYWITSQGVFRVPASGGAMTSISSEGGSIGIGLDASSVYWATDPTNGGNGKILKLPK